MEGGVVAMARTGGSRERFLLGKTFPIAPITQTTARANDQLLFPMLPPTPTASTATAVASRLDYQLQAKDPSTGTLIDNAVAAKHESCPAMRRPPPTAAAVIAALASECCMQLSREGSGYGGDAAATTSPHNRTPR